MVETELRSDSVALGVEIAGQHGRSSLASERCQQNTDGALPNDEHSFVGLQMEQLNCLIAGVYRLDKSGLLERNLIGNLDKASANDPVQDANVFVEAATRGSKASCAAHPLVDLALGEGLLAAIKAFATGNVMVGHDAVPHSEAADILARADDGPRHLVSEDTRRIMRAGVDLLEVGAADSSGVNLDQHFAYAYLGNGNRLYMYVVFAAIHSRAHGRGNS